MTTAATDRPNASARKAPTRPRRALGDHVAATVGKLQAQVLHEPPVPEAVGAIARLRRCIGRIPGADYTLGTYLSVPDELLRGRPRTETDAYDAEYAVHDAITLYALHQQSRRERMHVSGSGLGVALAALVRKSVSPEGVRRRFAALGTATSYAESIHHLRGLVTMLREHQIPVDYGLLADDLYTLRQPAGQPPGRPSGRATVQAVWGREFFRTRPTAGDTNDSGNPSDSATETEERAQ
ncbi:type I-E CRISPR-associated protein Cse2/CasB [Dactylosporangium sp. NPDC005572]|uniref:type I-E CRISPR-associated protein Cse2/CasB n=1 Tax=Dactylosporangium sp. NPDC005572 TaxID=3156889 RepID=UPI0033A01BD1